MHAVLATGASTTLMSLPLVNHSHLKIEERESGDGGEWGKIRRVLESTTCPIFFGDLHALIDFLVIMAVPFNLVIGPPTLKRLDRVLDCRSEEVRPECRRHKAVARMLSKYVHPRRMQY